MADSKKPRHDDSSSDEECIVEDMSPDENAEEEDMEINEQIQVDFEGFGIQDSDFHGIRQMLQQLFPKDNIDISEVSNIIIRQNFIGTLLKQGEMQDDDSDDDEYLDQVFGVTSCISCNGMHNLNPAIGNVMSFLSDKCSTYATDDKIKAAFKKILEAKKEESCLGWIINERFINIPPQVSLPMFEKLQMELGEARGKKHKTCYDFTHYMMICKTFTTGIMKDGSKFQPDVLEYINSEEELFAEDAYVQFTYPVAGGAAMVGGKWDEDSAEMQPCRTVLIFEKDKVTSIMGRLKEQLSVPLT